MIFQPNDCIVFFFFLIAESSPIGEVRFSLKCKKKKPIIVIPIRIFYRSFDIKISIIIRTRINRNNNA